MLMLLGELNGGNEEVSAPDQVALKEILNHVEDEGHKVNDATLADFVRKVCMILQNDLIQRLHKHMFLRIIKQYKHKLVIGSPFYYRHITVDWF